MDKAQLGEFNYYLMGDASGSMGSASDTPTGATRWKYMRESFIMFATQISAIDSDGIGLILFNGKGITAKDNVQPNEVTTLFDLTKVGSSTPTAAALTAAINLSKASNKKAFIQCWTDGVPDDMAAVEKVILEQAAKQQNDEDLTIQFVQVGKDVGATEWLKKLDNLQGAKFDIVNVVTIDQAEDFNSIEDMILAGISG